MYIILRCEEGHELHVHYGKRGNVKKIRCVSREALCCARAVVRYARASKQPQLLEQAIREV